MKLFSTYFQKNTQVSHLMKVHPVGAVLFLMDGQMDEQMDEQTDKDMMKLTVTFCNSVNMPKNWKCQRHIKLKIDIEA
jgi:hypothetical protein